jgi:AraC family transcriptional regulator
LDMSNGLQLQHLKGSIETEPTYYMQHQQSLAKVLSPARYQHGVSRNKLFDYSYGAGELIVCNRGIDEFVRWNSEIQILKVDLPDEAFRAVAEEAGLHYLGRPGRKSILCSEREGLTPAAIVVF